MGCEDIGIKKSEFDLEQKCKNVKRAHNYFLQIVELRSHTESPLELGGGITIHDSISILR